jgi:hypothetical protein
MFEVVSKYRNGFDVIVLRTNSLVNAIEFANQLENDWQIQTEQGEVIIETDMETGMEFRQDIRPILLDELLDVLDLFIQKICGFRRLKSYYSTIDNLLQLMGVS